jgi:hypothetical protein
LIANPRHLPVSAIKSTVLPAAPEIVPVTLKLYFLLVSLLLRNTRTCRNEHKCCYKRSDDFPSFHTDPIPGVDNENKLLKRVSAVQEI